MILFYSGVPGEPAPERLLKEVAVMMTYAHIDKTMKHRFRKLVKRKRKIKKELKKS